MVSKPMHGSLKFVCTCESFVYTANYMYLPFWSYLALCDSSNYVYACMHAVCALNFGAKCTDRHDGFCMFHYSQGSGQVDAVCGYQWEMHSKKGAGRPLVHGELSHYCTCTVLVVHSVRLAGSVWPRIVSLSKHKLEMIYDRYVTLN